MHKYLASQEIIPANSFPMRMQLVCCLSLSTRPLSHASGHLSPVVWGVGLQGQFLLLATLANVGKSIGVTTANVVRAPIQMSFSLKANLADIAARTSAQQVRKLSLHIHI